MILMISLQVWTERRFICNSPASLWLSPYISLCSLGAFCILLVINYILAPRSALTLEIFWLVYAQLPMSVRSACDQFLVSKYFKSFFKSFGSERRVVFYDVCRHRKRVDFKLIQQVWTLIVFYRQKLTLKSDLFFPLLGCTRLQVFGPVLRVDRSIKRFIVFIHIFLQ